VHELTPRRTAWLQLLEGAVTLEDLLLGGGDGVGLTDERAVSLTANEASELLLLDFGADPP
jgi:hypothetical protein